MLKLEVTLKEYQGTISARHAVFPYLWCVYEHTTETPGGVMLLYIGVCRLRDLYEFPDARKNSAWREMIKADIVINMKILATANHQIECVVMRGDLVKQRRPYCNLNGQSFDNARSVVICNETGAEFATAKKCSEAMGISAAALSYHLNGRVGYATVGGFTFRRGDPPKALHNPATVQPPESERGIT